MTQPDSKAAGSAGGGPPPPANAQRRIGIAVLAAAIIVACAAWTAWLMMPPPGPPSLPAEVTAAMVKIRAAMESKPEFADVGLAPMPDHSGVIVRGDLKTGAHFEDLKRRVEAAGVGVKVEFEVAVARK